jgi:hypothetical protein
MRHGFRRRTAHADFHQLRIAQHPGGQPLDLRRQRGGKKQSLPVGRDFFTIRRTSGRKPMSSMRSTSSSTRIVDVAKIHARLARADRARRPGVATRMSTPRFNPRVVCRSRRRRAQRPTQIGEAAVIAKRRLHLRGELARRLEHETTEIFRASPAASEWVSANAAVLPVPVWAVPIKSFPARTIGKARSWIGVGSANPIACVPRTTSGERPKLLNDTSSRLAPVAHLVIPSLRLSFRAKSRNL